MPYQMKPLTCDPAKIKGMSERLILSHYDNNYGGAVKRLNVIEEKLAELDYANAPGFLINGLKREQLIAMNSMILHELFFDGLGEQGMDAGAPNSSPWARRSAAGPDGCCWHGPRATASLSISGHPTTAIRWRAARQSWPWTCTSTPTTSTSAPRQEVTSIPS